MNYDTAIVLRDTKGNYMHSMVGLDSNGKICDRSRNRLNAQCCVSPIEPVYMHTFATRDDGIKAQRTGNAIMKLFYVPGGTVDARLPQDTVKAVYELAERNLTDAEVAKYFINFSKKYIDLAKNRFRNDLKGGLVYVMKDYDHNGKVYYKIGMTNQSKCASGRLEQLKAEHYLSGRATCVLALNFEKYFDAAEAEGYFQAFFHSKKMTAPYRPNNSYGTRDQCDECYRLNDADIEVIKQKYNRYLAQINKK